MYISPERRAKVQKAKLLKSQIGLLNKQVQRRILAGEVGPALVYQKSADKLYDQLLPIQAWLLDNKR